MFAFLRSNLYPVSIAQNPELRSRLDDIRFGMVSSAVKMRANVNAGTKPLCDIERDSVVLAEILLKELKFCGRTINFIYRVATNYHKDVAFVAFTKVDNAISDLEAQAQVQVQDNVLDGLGGLVGLDECEQKYKRTHSAQLLAETTDIRCNFASLCDSLGTSLIGISNANADTAANDSELFASIHSHIATSDDGTVSGYFDSICDISRAAWNTMTAMAFAHLYRYHCHFHTHMVDGAKPFNPANPDDEIFAKIPTCMYGDAPS